MNKGDLTAGLRAEYDALVSSRRGRRVTGEVFEAGKIKIFNRMRGILKKREDAKLIKEGVRLMKKELEIQPKEVGAMKIAKKGVKLYDTGKYIKEHYAQKFRVKMTASRNSEAEKVNIEFTMDAENSLTKTFDKLKRKVLELLEVQEGSDGADEPIIYKLEVSKFKKVKGQRAIQHFREGSSNCFLTPIITMMEGKKESYKTPASVKKMADKIRIARALESQYRESGVPEEEIEGICKRLNVVAKFHNMFSASDTVYNEKAQGIAVSFINSRMNHVDYGSIVLKEKPMVVSKDQYELLRSGVCVLEGLGKYPVVRTLTGAYRIEEEKDKLMNDMYERYKLGRYTVDAVKYPSLTSYIRSGYLVSSTPVIFRGGAVCNLDMVKAYSQFQACPYYNGFLGKVWRYCTGNFSMKFIHEHIGIYTFKIVSWKFDLSVLSIIRKLGLRVGQCYTLPSVEIECLVDLGLEVSVVAGCWGSSFDFTMSDELVSSGAFREWSGRLAMDNGEKVYRFEGSEEFSQHIAYSSPDCNVDWNNGMITVYVPKKCRPTLTHIGAFITSYTRINILLKMKSIGFQNICKVMLDGIYCAVDCVEDGLFKKKPLKKHNDYGIGWYECATIPDFEPFDSVGNACALLGAGGTGKTYSVLANHSYHDVLYVSPTRYLGLKMNGERGCRWATLAKFAGLDCVPWIDDGWKCSVALFDEGTMCSAEDIEKARAICDREGIMFLYAGDMEGSQWFQCRGGDGVDMTELYDINGLDKKVFSVDYRAVCPVLRDLKVRMRDFMRSIFTGSRDDCAVMEAWTKCNVPVIPWSEAVKEFSAGDVWIAPTHKQSLDLLSIGVRSGWRRLFDGSGYLKGEILPSDVGGCQERGSITTHSCQGLTLKCKIFISLERSFDYAMLYTALSRAVRMSDLRFVVGGMV